MRRWLLPLLALLLVLCPRTAWAEVAACAGREAVQAQRPDGVGAADHHGEGHVLRAPGAEDLLRRVDTRAPTADDRADDGRPPVPPLRLAAHPAADRRHGPDARPSPGPRTCERLPYHAAAPPLG